MRGYFKIYDKREMIGSNPVQFRGGHRNAHDANVRADKEMIDPVERMGRHPSTLRLVRIKKQLSITKLNAHAFINHGVWIRVKIPAQNNRPLTSSTPRPIGTEQSFGLEHAFGRPQTQVTVDQINFNTVYINFDP